MTLRHTLQYSAVLIIRPNTMKYFTIKEDREGPTLHEMVPTEHLVEVLDKYVLLDLIRN